MNTNWINLNKSIMWKEIIEYTRSFNAVVPLMVATVIIVQYFFACQILNSHAIQNIKELTIMNLMVYLPLMLVPLVGNNFLRRSIYEERKSYALHNILAYGIPPTALWNSKFWCASIISYLWSVLSIICFTVILYFRNHFIINMNISIFFLVFLAIPVLAMGILSLMSVFYWAFRNVDIIALVYTYVTLFGVWFFSLKMGNNNCSFLSGIIALIIGFAIIVSSLVVVHFISKERITNLD